MTVYDCRHTWLIIIVDIHDCLSLQTYMTVYHCKYTWLFIISDRHDCLSLQTYMTAYHCRHTWLFIIADIHDCLSLQICMTVYHCKQLHTWLFIATYTTLTVLSFKIRHLLPLDFRNKCLINELKCKFYYINWTS